MRTTLIIPDELMEKVRLLSGESSMTKAVVWALESCVKSKGQVGLLALRGKLELDYDWQRREEEELESQRQREEFLGQRT